MKYLHHVYLLLSVACILISCQSSQTSPKKSIAQKEEQSQKQLKINIGSEPDSLDPRKARTLQAMTFAKMLFEGLTRLDDKNQVLPALANRIDLSEEDTRYTFYLRTAYWTNGDRVTAHDFVRAWKQVLDPSFLSAEAFQLYVIKNAKKIKSGDLDPGQLGLCAIDDNTLQVDLEHPVPYFTEMIALPIYFPMHSKGADLDLPLSNGPFVLKQWKHHDFIHVEKNLNYWDADHVKLPSILFSMVSDEETAYRLFERNEVDWAGSPLFLLPFNVLRELKNRADLQEKPLLGSYFVKINTECSPFDAVEMRKAFGLAISRKEIAEHVTAGTFKPLTSFVPPNMGLPKVSYFADGDIEAAQRLFTKEGGILKGISLIFTPNERNCLVAQILQKQWFKALGIHVSLEPLEPHVFYARLSSGQYQLALACWTADVIDPINFLEIFKYKTSGNNNTFWENAQFRECLDKASFCYDKELRLNLLQQSEKILMDQMPVIPLFQYMMFYLQSSRVKNVQLSSTGVLDFKYAELN